jgi:hypothetical protein
MTAKVPFTHSLAYSPTHSLTLTYSLTVKLREYISKYMFPQAESVVSVAYVACPAGIMSDHRPVKGIYELYVKHIDYVELEETLLGTHALTHSLSHWLTHSLIHSFTHSLTHSLTYSLTYSLTHSLTHLLSYSLRLWKYYVQARIMGNTAYIQTWQ